MIRLPGHQQVTGLIGESNVSEAVDSNLVPGREQPQGVRTKETTVAMAPYAGEGFCTWERYAVRSRVEMMPMTWSSSSTTGRWWIL